MLGRMVTPLSVDLRERVVNAYNNKEGSTRDLADRFGISSGTVSNWVRQSQERGTLEPSSPPGRPSFWQQEQKQALLEQRKKSPDATLEQLADELAPKLGKSFDPSVLSRMLAKLGQTRKKKTSTPANETRRNTKPSGRSSKRGSTQST